jgi:hypothetical protein
MAGGVGMSLDVMKQALDALETNLLVIEDYGDHEQLNRQHKAITALRAAIEQAQESVQVSPLEFAHMVLDKEHLVGKPVFWAEWPNKEKNT